MELIDGKLYMMGFATLNHQATVMELSRQLANYLLGKSCRVYMDAAVKLANNTIYLPDLAVICDRSKLSHPVYCEGAPDLIIEILSPSSTRHDKITKLKAYRKAGVKEYWIVDIDNHIVTVHILVNDLYTVDSYSPKENDKSIPVRIFSDFEIDLTTVFQEEANEED